MAKWTNGGGDEEWYYFMGAGAGMSASMLPDACSALPSGLAMVQFKPDGTPECYPAADLSGTSLVELDAFLHFFLTFSQAQPSHPTRVYVM